MIKKRRLTVVISSEIYEQFEKIVWDKYKFDKGGKSKCFEEALQDYINKNSQLK